MAEQMDDSVSEQSDTEGGSTAEGLNSSSLLSEESGESEGDVGSPYSGWQHCGAINIRARKGK